MKRWIVITSGFVFLFLIYHFPEFYQSFLLTAVFKIGFLVTAIVLCRLQGWKLLEGYGFSFAGRWHKLLAVGLLTGFILFNIAVLLSVGFNYTELNNIQSLSFFLKSLPLTLLMTFFPSVAEDILTRGYLFGHLKFLKPVYWILLSATIYVLNHIWRLNENVSVLSYLFILGLVLGFCIIISKSLWLAFGIHWGANIAFELGNSGLHPTDIGNTNASTWMLSLVWGILLIFLLIRHNRSLKSYCQPIQ